MQSSYPLHGRLISGSGLEEWLRKSIAATQHEAWLCSAFIRSETFVGLLDDRVLDEPLKASVLVRWQAQDLLTGSSDLDLFPVCEERRIELYLKLDFHGKVYALPPLGIGVGSANATGSGLGFGDHPNAEVNTLVTCTCDNLRIVLSQFVGATRVTSQLYERIRFELDGMRKYPSRSPQWSSDITALLNPPSSPDSLLVDECFMTDGQWWLAATRTNEYSEAKHDLELLGFPARSNTTSNLEAPLRRSKCFRWLEKQLRLAPEDEMYFGALSVALHNSLLDDPAPRRCNVKTLVQNLLSWVQMVGVPEIVIDRPNYSQRIKLLTTY
jgi:hypothetical protein